MTTFKGNKVFRPSGQPKNNVTEDWSSVARRAVMGGGRIIKSKSGEQHIVSPSGAHWGTYKAAQGLFEGGTLKQYQGDDDGEDITSTFQ